MTWYVIASCAGAHIYNLNPRNELKLLHELPNELGRLRNKEMQYDEHGLSTTRYAGYPGYHKFGNEKNPHEDATEQFARKVARRLKTDYERHNFDSLTFISGPKFLGQVRKNMPKHLVDKIEWVTKDLENVPDHKKPEHLGFKKIPDSTAYIHDNRTLSS